MARPTMVMATSGGRTAVVTKTKRPTTATVAIAVAVSILVAMCTATTSVSAITTKPSVATAAIKTTLQIYPAAADEKTIIAATNDKKPSYAARYWQQHQQRNIGIDDFVQQPPHRLSAAQQAHILDDIRRHNQQQQWWTSLGSSMSTALPQSTDKTHVDNDSHRPQDSEADQLQQLIQINGVAAVDDTLTDSQDDDRHSRQRSIGWQSQPQPTQVYNRQQSSQQQPSLSPYVPPPPAMTTISLPQHQQQYYPTMTSTSTSSATQLHQHHHQQQQLFVTTPSSPSTSSSSASSPVPTASNSKHQQQQFIPLSQPQPHQQQYYSQQAATAPTSSVVGNDDRDGVSVGDLDPEIELQIRQQLTAVAGAGGGNYTILTSNGTPVGSIGAGGGIVNLKSPQSIAGSASNNNVQFVQLGNGDDGSGTAFSRDRLQQQLETSLPSIFSGAAVGGGNKNTVVKTVVVRQKSPPPTQPTAAPSTPAPAVGSQHVWTASEREQLEQLARQVLPPGVADYEIIRAGGVDGGGGGGDTTAAATASVADGAQRLSSAAGTKNKKPVTFVILEERPDGTVQVRGVEKKNQDGGGSSNVAGDGAANSVSAAVADDEQLQQLVDRLNKGELKLPSATAGAQSKTDETDNAAVASSTVSASPPSFAPTASIPLASNGVHKSREPPTTAYFPTVTTPRTTTVTLQQQHHRHQQQQQQQQTIFLPTAVPTVTSAVTTTVGQANQHRYHQQQQQQPQQQQQQQQYYSTPVVASSTSSAQPPVINSTSSYYNSKTTKDGVFSGALRRRGYYAMAKYMRQAGIDSVLEDTGPFTIFVPTDKAFRSLLVQLGGPDRAEEKFRENPRLLIGLLLHHVVPGAFRAADLMAGDEMTGVSLAGTQLRANLYARQLYDNRWNDIEVLTVNGARVLDDVPASSALSDDGSSTDESAVGPAQQRRDMILSSSSERLMGSENQQIMAIGHAVDRVLFPLPVGDLLTTMRADRQRRYSVFLRAVDEHCSPSVRALLTGSRTLTVFAPVDEAFRVRLGSGNFSNSGGSSGSIVDWLLRDDPNRKFKKRNRRKIADRFVLSHVVLAGSGDPPMYTAGLRFYQVRDTAYRIPEGGISEEPTGTVDDGNDEVTDNDNGSGDDEPMTLPHVIDGDKPRYYQLTVYKDSGKIRLNGGAAQVLVRNVPATNGVLHGIDAPLV